jgi:hypothetical protein
MGRELLSNTGCHKSSSFISYGESFRGSRKFSGTRNISHPDFSPAKAPRTPSRIDFFIIVSSLRLCVSLCGRWSEFGFGSAALWPSW